MSSLIDLIEREIERELENTEGGSFLLHLLPWTLIRYKPIKASTTDSLNLLLQNNKKYTFCYFNNSLFGIQISTSLL
jgi:hypothetical protein